MAESHDTDVDELEGAPAGRPIAPLAVAVGILLAVAVVLSAIGHGGSPHHRVAMPSPAPLPAPAPVAAQEQSHGSVFLEHLAGCTHSDRAGRLIVAVGVTNLGSRPLRLLNVRPEFAAPGLRFTGARIGSAPCAATGHPGTVRLAPSHGVVVALSFSVDPPCSADDSVAARVTFDVSGTTVHADSSELADLSGLGSVCAQS